MRKVVITDLTRFANKEKVCIAAIDLANGECFRPLPYLSSEKCAELNIQPGAILEGKIRLKKNLSNPHIEDAEYNNLKYMGNISAKDFKQILDNSLSNSVSSGFGIKFAIGQKYIPLDETALCSIITIKVNPKRIFIHEDQFKAGKVKISFYDNNNQQFRYLSITDRGFYDYAEQHQNDGKLNELETFVKSQKDIYLRVGVGREWTVNDKTGYWLQVNGIYTFPNYHSEIRSYNKG